MKEKITDYRLEVYKNKLKEEKMTFRFLNAAPKNQVLNWVSEGFVLSKSYPLYYKINNGDNYVTFEEILEVKGIHLARWGNHSDLLNLRGDDCFDLYESSPIIDSKAKISWVNIIDKQGIIEVNV